jgi:YjjI family glycine radical enzyme
VDLADFRVRARDLVEDPVLSYRQRVARLAALAEDALPAPPVSEACRRAQVAGVVHDMGEGHAPYRPRYILPDYQRVLDHGSEYLELPPAEDLEDALAALLAAYGNVESITGYPVYLGAVDELLEPFAFGVDQDHLQRALRRQWRLVDRLLPDAFVHANLGPHDSRVARTILAVERDLLQVVPNLTLKVDPDTSPDGLLLDAIATVFACAKPHFVDDRALRTQVDDRYGVVSCYNSLRQAGGSHTLVRLNLAAAATRAANLDDYLTTVLPEHVELTAELIESRVRYLVEHVRWYEHSWLVREGLVDPGRFTAMFGVFGLAEAVDALLAGTGAAADPRRSPRYGSDAEADDVAQRIVARVAELVAGRPVPYCVDGRAALHAQSGIDTDIGVTAGTRVPIGHEPPLHRHLATVAPLHHWFSAGVSDIVHLEDTARRNPEAVLDLIRGAFASGMREFTFNVDSNGFIRITGYLVRKADVAAAAEGARHGSTFLGADTEAHNHVTGRVAQRVEARELAPGRPR